MYQVTWITDGKVFATSTPSEETAFRLFFDLAGHATRLWFKAAGQKAWEMLF